jgi:UDPglucose 6-dehydrogenase
MTSVSVFGLGKLGLPLAAVLASKGHQVIGVDLNETVVREVAIGMSPIEETGLQALMDTCEGRLTATTNVDRAIAGTDVSFIITPTPSKDDGTFTNEYVLQAIDSISDALKSKSTRHTVVVSSTVMPGSCWGPIRTHLQRSGKVVGETLGLCYSPEFIALGSVIYDMTHPDMVLVGESDPASGDVLQGLLETVVETDPPFKRMSLANAELAKIAVNTYVTMKISYANTLAEMCEQIPGGDASVVTEAVGADSRIGRKYLVPATAFGGPCFPRDNRAFAALAVELKTEAPLALATDQVNDRQVRRLADQAYERGANSVAILGLSYKPGTSVVEESVGTRLAQVLVDYGINVHVFDPVAQESAFSVLGDLVHWGSSAVAVIDKTDYVVICTPWEDFKTLEFPKPTVVVDCWGVVSDVPAWVQLHKVGRS